MTTPCLQRSVRVLDGAVVLFDGVAGVEAQSETVWSQAARYSVPVIGFVNKLDREGGDYFRTATAMQKRLGAQPLLLHLPVGKNADFVGIVDVVSMQLVLQSGEKGERVHATPLGEAATAAAFLPAAVNAQQLQKHAAQQRMDMVSVYGDAACMYCGQSRPKGCIRHNQEVLSDRLIAPRSDDWPIFIRVHVLQCAFLLLCVRPARMPAAFGQPSGPSPLCCKAVSTHSPHLRLQLQVLSEHDDGIMEALLELMDSEDAAAVAAGGIGWPGLGVEAVQAAIRAATLDTASPLVPLLAGSAYKNKGVQTLMDAVCAYLPSPGDMPPLVASKGSSEPAPTGKKTKRRRKQSKGAGKNTCAEDDGTTLVRHTTSAPLCAFVFKVGRHPTRGVLSYFRVYSGVWSDKLPLLNTSQGTKERASKLLQLFADDAREVKSVPAGHIGAAIGLQHAVTGDTLVLAGDPCPLRLPGLNIPAPVFTAALETDTISQAAALEAALAVLTREDPSLVVTTSPDTGQLLLSGMGALHLEVACDRLQREHKVAVSLGPMVVAYREAALGEGSHRTLYNRQLGDKQHWATVAFKIVPHSPEAVGPYGDDADAENDACTFGVAGSDSHTLAAVQVDGSSTDAPAWGEDWTGASTGSDAATTPLTAEQSDAVHDAVEAWFARGPMLGAPLSRLHVEWVPGGCAVSPLTTPAALRAATASALGTALAEAGSGLLEPMVLVNVTVSDKHTGRVLNDLTSGRRGNIIEVGAPEATIASGGATAAISAGKTTISATVPAREMVTYATHLRSITGGEGGFSMAFSHYADVPPNLIDAIRAEM